MEAITTIKFDGDGPGCEQDVLATALRSITIAFPDHRGDQDRDKRDPRIRALTHIATGNAATREQLERADEALQMLQEACYEQRQVTYWTNLAGNVEGEANGVPFVTDPALMAVVLAEARTLQYREACEAIRLVEDAQELLGEIVEV